MEKDEIDKRNKMGREKQYEKIYGKFPGDDMSFNFMNKNYEGQIEDVGKKQMFRDIINGQRTYIENKYPRYSFENKYLKYKLKYLKLKNN